MIYDIDHQLSNNPQPLGVPTKFVMKGKLGICQVTDTEDWKVNMVVDEGTELRCSVAIRASKQEVLLNPAFFVNVILPAAVWWRTLPLRDLMPHENEVLRMVLPLQDTDLVPQVHQRSSKLNRYVYIWGDLCRCNFIGSIDKLPHFITSVLTNLTRRKKPDGFEELDDEGKASKLYEWFSTWLEENPSFFDPSLYNFSQSEVNLANRILL